ncbi:hypothetical protein ACF07V_31210 [Streptomyces sp. NPDC015661]|uniref:hypothetical protein n=1 Tax=Streptomyces sp. NPDC015661 TaxID=3364961 RepID=UPI003702894A
MHSLDEPLGLDDRVLAPGDDGADGELVRLDDGGGADGEPAPLDGAGGADGELAPPDGAGGADGVDAVGVGAEEEQAVMASDAAKRVATGSAALCFHVLGRGDFAATMFSPLPVHHGGFAHRPQPRGSPSRSRSAPAPPGSLERASTIPQPYARPGTRHHSPTASIRAPVPRSTEHAAVGFSSSDSCPSWDR